MTVYIEYVLIDNFFIDYLLLKTTFYIVNLKASKGRISLSAFIGSLIALLFPMLNFETIFVVSLKLTSCLLILLCATKYPSSGVFFISAFIFLFLTFALGGAIIGVFSLLNLDYSSELSIATMFLPASLIMRSIFLTISYVFNQSKIKKYSADCTLFMGNKSLQIRGFFDTGNSLFYCGKPVVVIDKQSVFKLVDDESFIKDKYAMEYQTSAGKSKMYLFFLDKIDIQYNEKKYSYSGIYLGVGNTFEKGLLLHPNLMENDYEETNQEIKATV